MDYKISEKTINNILNYLATRPWSEANPYIVALKQIEPITEKKKEEEK